jgi:hypothetical protein
MTDEEILRYCKEVLDKNKSMSVAWHMIHQLRQKDRTQITRIRDIYALLMHLV